MTQVLVVDDSSVVRKVARRILERAHVEVVEAEDGREGLDHCAVTMPDVVMLDGAMPQMDGFAFVRELRRMPGGKKPKVLFCGTDNDLAQIARARHCGADEFFMKPFDVATFEAKFHDLGIV